MISMQTKQPGFSLTEIIIALMIIGTMFGATLGLMVWVGNAKKTATSATLRNIKLAIDTYQSAVDIYPSSLEDLYTRPTDEKISRRWKGPYLDEETSRNDKWGKEIQYNLNPKGQTPPYELYSYGPKGPGAVENEWIYA